MRNGMHNYPKKKDLKKCFNNKRLTFLLNAHNSTNIQHFVYFHENAK